MRLSILTLGLVAVGLSTQASAQSGQMTDPNTTCADYLKIEAQAGPTPKTGDAATDKMAAELDKKMSDYCKANPTAKASDAMMKVMGD